MWEKLDKIAKTEAVMYSVGSIFFIIMYFLNQFNGWDLCVLLFITLIYAIQTPTDSKTRARLQELKELKEKLGLHDFTA